MIRECLETKSAWLQLFNGYDDQGTQIKIIPEKYKNKNKTDPM